MFLSVCSAALVPPCGLRTWLVRAWLTPAARRARASAHLHAALAHKQLQLPQGEGIKGPQVQLQAGWGLVGSCLAARLGGTQLWLACGWRTRLGVTFRY